MQLRVLAGKLRMNVKFRSAISCRFCRAMSFLLFSSLAFSAAAACAVSSFVLLLVVRRGAFGFRAGSLVGVSTLAALVGGVTGSAGIGIGSLALHLRLLLGSRLHLRYARQTHIIPFTLPFSMHVYHVSAVCLGSCCMHLSAMLRLHVPLLLPQGLAILLQLAPEIIPGSRRVVKSRLLIKILQLQRELVNVPDHTCESSLSSYSMVYHHMYIYIYIYLCIFTCYIHTLYTLKAFQVSGVNIHNNHS